MPGQDNDGHTHIKKFLGSVEGQIKFAAKSKVSNLTIRAEVTTVLLE